METILGITIWLMAIMLFGIVIAVFIGFCYLIYKGIAYAYKRIKDVVEDWKIERKMKKTSETCSVDVDEENKEQQCESKESVNSLNYFYYN